MKQPIRWSDAKEAEQLLAQQFALGGWSVSQQPASAGHRVDLLVSLGPLAYAVELKSAPEGRKDRLVPLLAQALLQAQSGARQLGPAVKPLAVIAAPRVSDVVLRELQRFAQEYVPDAAIGVLDQQGLLWFSDEALKSLNASRSVRQPLLGGERAIGAHLFSDLNQWMLKLLLASYIPVDLLSAPRGEFRNASQLAQAANVSAMSASRFIRRLKPEGFLDEHADALRVVRRGSLLQRWRAAHLRSSPEWPMKWVIRGNPEKQLEKLLQSAAPDSVGVVEDQRESHRWPRMCLGYFAAAEQLGFGFVHGIKPHVYVDHFDSPVLQQLGLAPIQAEAAPDVIIKIPMAPQAVFRAVVWRHGIPVADILQVWLDVANHPARGEAQAAEIERRLLAPMFKGS